MGNCLYLYLYHSFGGQLSASLVASDARIVSQALVHVGHVVMTVTDGQVFLRGIWIPSVSVILSILHTNSLTCHQNYTIFES
jgi:hypothetical protein